MPRKRIVKEESADRVKKDPQLAGSSRNFDRGEGVYQKGQLRKKFFEKNEEEASESKPKSKVEQAAKRNINDGFNEKDYEVKKTRRPDSGDRPYGERKPYQSRDNEGRSGYKRNESSDRPYGERKPYESRGNDSRSGYKRNDSSDRPYGERKPYQSRDGGGRSDYNRNESGDRPIRRKYDDGRNDESRETRNSRPDNAGSRDEKYSDKRSERPFTKDRGYSNRGDTPLHRDQLKPPSGSRKSRGTEGGYGSRDVGSKGKSIDKREKPATRDRGEYTDRGNDRRNTETSRYRDDKDKKFGSDRKSYGERSNRYEKKPYKAGKVKAGERQTNSSDGPIRLNKYIANAGICSRREADEYITAGLITVNGVVITELGSKVNAGDKVKYNGAAVRGEALRYVLLNKPKDYLCTMDDPQERKTVMELVRSACRERIYPIGRLDRNTTGLLLLTNDGLMADKLMHPRTEIKKIYQVELDKNMRAEHLEQLRNGIQLEDGFIKPDEIGFDEGSGSRRILGVSLHSGRNRIVRRMMEHFGYQVVKLDRTYYAGLTKKDLPRGKYRMLTEMELNMLKMVSGKSQ